MQSHIRKVYACLAVACHLHFWQNDRDLLRATPVKRGWNGYRSKSQHRKLTLEKKFSRRSCRDSNPQHFDHGSGALTTELSPLSVVHSLNKSNFLGTGRSSGSSSKLLSTSSSRIIKPLRREKGGSGGRKMDWGVSDGGRREEGRERKGQVKAGVNEVSESKRET